MKRKVITNKNLRNKPPIALLLALFCFIDRFEMNDVLYGIVWTNYVILCLLFISGYIMDLCNLEEVNIFNEKN